MEADGPIDWEEDCKTIAIPSFGELLGLVYGKLKSYIPVRVKIGVSFEYELLDEKSEIEMLCERRLIEAEKEVIRWKNLLVEAKISRAQAAVRAKIEEDETLNIVELGDQCEGA